MNNEEKIQKLNKVANNLSNEYNIIDGKLCIYEAALEHIEDLLDTISDTDIKELNIPIIKTKSLNKIFEKLAKKADMKTDRLAFEIDTIEKRVKELEND